MVNNEITLASAEWRKFVEWLRSVYETGDANRIVSELIRGVYATPRVPVESSQYFQFWEQSGKPTAEEYRLKQERAGMTEAERIQELRDAMTPEGNLPYKGFEEWQEYLEGRGFELVETDPLGKITEPFYKLKPEEKKEGVETDPLTEALLRLPLEQFKWQQEEVERARREAELERQGQQQWARMRSQSEDLQRQQMPFQAEAIEQQKLQAMIEAWEAGRSGRMASLSEPRSWIQRYMAERQPNPYREQLNMMRLSPLQERERALFESQQVAGQVTPGMFGEDVIINPSLVAGQDDRTMWLAGQLTQREKAYKEELAATKERSKALDYITNPAKYQDLPLAKQQQMAALGMEVSTGGLEHWQVEAQQRAGQPATPAIPEWMSRMTGISGNVPLKPTEIPTPSAQQWARLPWSQREQFGGLVEFAGDRPFRDVLEQMSMMLPQPKRGAVWSPTRQRTMV